MLKVAITGNIASGNSEVEKIISDFYPVYDVDKIAHAILGNIDRKALGEKVFSDPKALKELEDYIHPRVKEEILNIFNGVKTVRNKAGLVGNSTKNNIVFISIPLLFETGFESLFDKIVFLQCNDDLRLERLIARNNYTKEYAIKRMNSQLPQEDKIKKSDYVLDNNSTKEDLKQQVLELLKIIKP